MIDWQQTVSDLKADIARRRLLDGIGPGRWATFALLFRRGMAAVAIYRLARFLRQRRRMGPVCHLLGYLEYFYTKDEISPYAQLGPGLVLADGGGIGITRVTVAGSNCTFLGCNSITLGAIEGFDVERDRIVFGDHCVFGVRARVMRPLSLADGTQVKPNSVALSSVPIAATTLSGIPARRRGTASLAEVMAWNPLRGGPIDVAHGAGR